MTAGWREDASQLGGSREGVQGGAGQRQRETLRGCCHPTPSSLPSALEVGVALGMSTPPQQGRKWIRDWGLRWAGTQNSLQKCLHLD